MHLRHHCPGRLRGVLGMPRGVAPSITSIDAHCKQRPVLGGLLLCHRHVPPHVHELSCWEVLAKRRDDLHGLRLEYLFGFGGDGVHNL